MAVPSIRNDALDDGPYGPESDACAIYLSARKYGQSTFGTLKRSIGALIQMGHRTGFVNGEGDGAGVQTDIPRRLWARKLSQASLRASLASHPGFWVGHLFVPSEADTPDLHDRIHTAFDGAGLNLIYQQPGRTRHEALGGNGRLNPPAFWQIAGYVEFQGVEKRLLEVQTRLETDFPIHFLSLSPHVVVYKVRGSVETLSRYFPDLQDRNYDTSVVLCHSRYSTNTVSSFDRAQPFALLGHNGEINTITRLRLEAEQIGVVLPRTSSDSQDVDRILNALCTDYGLDLVEAMETVFPPVPYELEQFPPEQRAVYTRIRQSFGPYAQGPAAILARFGDTIVASVDALGLRPLWFVETEKEFLFSSERGAIPLEVMVTEPRALGPGEKMAIHLNRAENAEILTHADIRKHVMNRAFQREAPQLARRYWASWEQSGWGQPPSRPHSRQAASEIQGSPAETPTPSELRVPDPLRDTRRGTGVPAPDARPEPAIPPWQAPTPAPQLEPYLLNANGWNIEHVQDIHDAIIDDKEISSLGYDGPLAVLARQRVNLADFFKETVAVVTNPAIDRGREAEVFSTSSLLGASPTIGQAPDLNDIVVTLKIPILTGGHPDLGGPELAQRLGEKFGTLSIEQMLEVFSGRTAWLVLGVLPGEDVPAALERLATQAVQAVENGAQCLMLDDYKVLKDDVQKDEILKGEILSEGYGWLDPTLAVSRIDEILRQAGKERQNNLRRRAGLVVRSAAIRTLHDIVLLSGFGADALNPYAMAVVAVTRATRKARWNGSLAEVAQERLLNSLKAGIEKVISTMGCHELRGYGRVCSSIGLAPSVAAVLKSPNFFGSENAGVTWERLTRESVERGQELRARDPACSLPRVDHFYPRLWKKVGLFTRSLAGYDEVLETYRELQAERPVALRHVLGFKKTHGVVIGSQVDVSVNDYSMPFVIGAMSFGSQGEVSFRTYAHAAARLNMICINGEGGELPEIMGVYKKNRGQQVASGRFGVNSSFLNSAAVIEIKIGQGAKPGEGGMLPGFKVTPQVAEARHTPAFVSLLSPSNNHDLYSIEDLAQLIEELKVVNPQAKVSVKCPVVPGIGVITVGIAKAGADIIEFKRLRRRYGGGPQALPAVRRPAGRDRRYPGPPRPGRIRPAQ